MVAYSKQRKVVNSGLHEKLLNCTYNRRNWWMYEKKKGIRIRNEQTKRKYFPSVFQPDKLYLGFIDSKNIMILSVEITTQGCK